MSLGVHPGLNMIIPDCLVSLLARDRFLDRDPFWDQDRNQFQGKNSFRTLTSSGARTGSGTKTSSGTGPCFGTGLSFGTNSWTGLCSGTGHGTGCGSGTDSWFWDRSQSRFWDWVGFGTFLDFGRIPVLGTFSVLVPFPVFGSGLVQRPILGCKRS